MNDGPVEHVDHLAEMTILGSLMLDSDLVAKVDLTPADFYRPANGDIYEAITRLADSGRSADAIAVADHLRTRGQLSAVGGAPYLHSCVASVHSTANIQHHVAIVARLSGLRRLDVALRRSLNIVGAVDDDDLTSVQGRVEAELRAATDGGQVAGVTHAAADLDVMLERLETRPRRVMSPWPELNKLIGGVEPGRMYVIGARPGHGKSIMGLQWAWHHAATTSQTVLFASLEMRHQEVQHRLLASVGQVDYARLQDHQLTNTDWKQISRAVPVLSELPIVVSDATSVSVERIRRQAGQLARSSDGLSMIVVDYLQLLQTPPGSRRPRHEVVGEFSRQLKLMAQELNVPLLALSQLNRGVESRTDRKPNLGDLRESGAVEQDADVVVLLHRGEKDEAHLVDVYVAKNRQGETGKVQMTFQGWWMRLLD